MCMLRVGLVKTAENVNPQYGHIANLERNYQENMRIMPRRKKLHNHPFTFLGTAIKYSRSA
jgi:hypothetical protein